MSPEPKIYSNRGNMMEEKLADSATLIHSEEIGFDGELLNDKTNRHGAVNYYIVLETQYYYFALNFKGRYEQKLGRVEHLIEKKRVTIPSI